MSLTAFVTGEALTQARLATLTSEITADIAASTAAEAALRTAAIAAEVTARNAAIASAGLPSTAANLVIAGPASGAAATAAARALVNADMPSSVFTDNRPAVANAADEEFDSSIGNFVNLNIASGATVTVAKGAVAILRPSTDATDVFRGVTKACPAGAWTFEAELSISALGSAWQFIGLCARRAGGTAPNVANTSTDKLAGWGVGSNTSGAVGAYAMKATTGSNVAGSSAFNGAAPNLRIGGSGRVFVRLAFDGTDTLVASVSNDGIGYVQYYSGSATTLIGGAPDTIALMINNESAFDCVGVCKYLRRIA